MKFKKNTLLWHDYETFGLDPKYDRPSQFAGIRTDEDLNIIDEPIMFYCKPANDFLPSPMACKVTGVTPKDALEKGMAEYLFIEKINNEMTVSNTCNVGFNSVAFDDEFTRFTLYRNMFDPYAREWKDGCSRWDVMNMMRLVALTKPDTLIWPLKENGTKSFRLEELSAANGIVHENAHDALADVYATIGVAKKIKEAQPKLYNYLYNLRSKHEVSKVIKKHDMLVHINSIYSGVKEFAAITHPLCVGGKYTSLNPNEVILVDLGREDFQDWINLPVEEIKLRLFSKKDILEERGVSRPGFNKIAINQCPTIADHRVVSKEKLEELNIKMEVCLKNLEYIKNNPEISKKMMTLFANDYPPINDPDASLYAGFIDGADRSKLDKLRRELDFNQTIHFKDNKFNEMTFRYKARNFPNKLTETEVNKWEEYRLDRIKNGGSMTLSEFKEETLLMIKEYPDSLSIAKDIISYIKGIGDKEIIKEMKSLEDSICSKKKKLSP
jgi:exodeoxyribonuclease-1